MLILGLVLTSFNGIVNAENLNTNNNVNDASGHTFSGYYPSGCTISGPSQYTPNAVQCKCYQDNQTGDVWLSNVSPNPENLLGAYTYVQELNKHSTCGFHDTGWSLPSHKQLQILTSLSSQDIYNFGFDFVPEQQNSADYWGMTCSAKEIKKGSCVIGTVWIINIPSASYGQSPSLVYSSNLNQLLNVIAVHSAP